MGLLPRVRSRVPGHLSRGVVGREGPGGHAPAVLQLFWLLAQSQERGRDRRMSECPVCRS